MRRHFWRAVSAAANCHQIFTPSTTTDMPTTEAWSGAATIHRRRVVPFIDSMEVKTAMTCRAYVDACSVQRGGAAAPRKMQRGAAVQVIAVQMPRERRCSEMPRCPAYQHVEYSTPQREAMAAIFRHSHRTPSRTAPRAIEHSMPPVRVEFVNEVFAACACCNRCSRGSVQHAPDQQTKSITTIRSACSAAKTQAPAECADAITEAVAGVQ